MALLKCLLIAFSAFLPTVTCPPTCPPPPLQSYTCIYSNVFIAILI